MSIVKFGEIVGIIDTFKDNYLLLDDGSVGFFIELENRDDISLTDEDIINNLNQQTISFYRLLDEKTEFSFIQFPEKNNKLINNYLNNCNNEDFLIKSINDIYKNTLINEYNNFGFTKLRSVLFFRFYLNTFAIPYKNRKLSYTEYDELIKEFTSKVSLYTESLKSINIKHKLLNIIEAHELISYLINPFCYAFQYPLTPIDFFYKVNSLDNSPGFVGLPLNDQFSSYATLYPDKSCPYFEYEGKKLFFNSIRIKHISFDLKYGLFRTIMSSKLPIFMISNFNIKRQQPLLHMLNASIRRKGQSIDQDKDHSISQEKVHMEEKELLDKVEGGGNMILCGDVNFLLFSDNKELLLKQSTAIVSYLNTNGVYANNDVGRQLFNYINSLPFKSRNSRNTGSFKNVKVRIDEITKSKKSPNIFFSSNLKRIITENLPFYVDPYDSDSGHPNPYMLFKNTLTKRPVGFAPFDQSYVPASNITITGSTGSGKSVFANLLLSRLLNMSIVPYIFTIDRGSSSKNLVTLMDGALLRIDPRNENSTLNIFDTDITDIDSPDSLSGKEKCNDVLHYILSLVYPTGIPKEVDIYKQSLLENIIRDTYKAKKRKTGIAFNTDIPESFPLISDFIDVINEKIKSKDPEYHDTVFTYIRNNLKPYIKGEFSKLVNSYSPKFKTKKIMSFDIDYIFSSKQILASEIIKITSIINNCTNKLYKDSSKTKWVLFIDEMWSFFMRTTHSDATSHMAYLIESGIREARKKGGLIINATQNFSDLLQTPTVINNSPIKFFGKTHDSTEIDLISKSLNLNDYERSLLINTGIVAGQLSRFFVEVSGKFRALVDISLTPLELAILTTNSDDLSHIKDWFDSNNKDMSDIYAWIDYSNIYPFSSLTDHYRSMED